MQLNKSSKKTKKPADKVPLAAAPEKSVPATEVKPKSRALKSSTSKKSEDAVSASSSHHHKPASSLAKPEPVPVVMETVTVSTTTTVVTNDDIAKLAHSYWATRGYAHGSSHEDWLRAERELLKKG